MADFLSFLCFIFQCWSLSFSRDRAKESRPFCSSAFRVSFHFEYNSVRGIGNLQNIILFLRMKTFLANLIFAEAPRWKTVEQLALANNNQKLIQNKLETQKDIPLGI